MQPNNYVVFTLQTSPATPNLGGSGYTLAYYKVITMVKKIIVQALGALKRILGPYSQHCIFCSFQMGPISWSVCSCQAFPA